jgi:hypothetical protein
MAPYISRIPNPRQPKVSRPSAFNRLPVELFPSIAEFISSTDLLCFSLVNKRLYRALDLERKLLWLLSPLTGKRKLSLLYRLERDNPSYYVCDHCVVLHKYNASEQFRHFNWDARFPCLDYLAWAYQEKTILTHNKFTHTCYVFLFLHLKLAMRRWYHGPQVGIATESLSHTEVKEYHESTTLFSVEAQICSTSPTHVGAPTSSEPVNLCLRTQDIMVVPREHRHRFTGTLDEIDPPQVFRICLHISNEELLRLVRCMVHAYNVGKKETRSNSQTCAECKTDYELQLVEFGQHELALIITKWMNLGDGLSPYDPQWKVHTLASLAWYMIGRQPLKLDHAVASPRRSFENTVPATWSSEALLSYNFSLLMDQEYQHRMGHFDFCRSTWILSPHQKPLENKAGSTNKL